MSAARQDMRDVPRTSRARCWLVVVEDLDDDGHVDILGPTTSGVAVSIAARLERVVEELGCADNYSIECRSLDGHDADEIEAGIRAKWDTDDVDTVDPVG